MTHYLQTTASIITGLVFLAACSENPEAPVRQTASDGIYETLEWTDLMPEQDLQALLNPPEYLSQIEEGSAEDLPALSNAPGQITPDDDYQRALTSANVKAELNGKNIRIPGYIVPLEFEDDQSITQFFLVPYFGACIHVPPPPPNQIVLVNPVESAKFEDTFNPYWITGKLTTQMTEHDLAVSAYTMEMSGFEAYQEY